jgi:O-antigen/teichoic acid export membrane protein
MTRAISRFGRFVMRPQFKLARDLGLLWVGQIGTKGVAFLAFAILARRLLPHEYGAVEYAMGLATLATLAIDGGLGSVGVRRLTQGHQSAEELVALIPAAQLCIAAVMAPAMVLFTWFYAHDADALKLTSLVALSLLIPPWKQDWLFQAKGMMTDVVLAQCVRVLSFMLGCVLLVHGDADVVRVGFAEIGSVALATGYLMWRQHSRVAPLRLRFALHKLADLLREGAAIGAGAICWALFQYAPLLILAAMAGMTDTAYFGAAHRLGVSLVTFSWLYHFNLYPVISRRVQGEPAALVRLTRMSIRATAWGGIGPRAGLDARSRTAAAPAVRLRLRACGGAFLDSRLDFPAHPALRPCALDFDRGETRQRYADLADRRRCGGDPGGMVTDRPGGAWPDGRGSGDEPRLPRRLGGVAGLYPYPRS